MRETKQQLTLGQIIEHLEAIEGKDTHFVYFGFEHAYPTRLTSWRGACAELALCFEFDGIAPTVAMLLAELKSAVCKTYEGYKGGTYRMSEQTPLWVANWGNAGSTAIVDVYKDGDVHIVILETQYQPY